MNPRLCSEEVCDSSPLPVSAWGPWRCRRAGPAPPKSPWELPPPPRRNRVGMALPSACPSHTVRKGSRNGSVHVEFECLSLLVSAGRPGSQFPLTLTWMPAVCGRRIRWKHGFRVSLFFCSMRLCNRGHFSAVHGKRRLPKGRRVSPVASAENEAAPGAERAPSQQDGPHALGPQSCRPFYERVSSKGFCCCLIFNLMFQSPVVFKNLISCFDVSQRRPAGWARGL